MSVKLLKRGAKKYSNVSFYRPICLVSLLGKALERIVDERLTQSRCTKLKAEQFGFREGRSTMNYPYQLIYDLKAKIASKYPCVATFYELEKAFVFNELQLTYLLSAGKLFA